MTKFLFIYTPDVRECYFRFQSELSMKKGLKRTREILGESSFDVYSEIVVTTTDKKFVFDLFSYKPYYHISDNFKYLEPVVKEICNRYFLNIEKGEQKCD